MTPEEKEKFRLESQRRLEMLEQTIAGLKTKAERRSEGDPDYNQHVAELELHKKAIEERLRDLDHSDRGLKSFFSDMDKSMRKALRYYK
jgi:hypothetical protein